MSVKCLKVLKREFREWCAQISIEEIISNGELIQMIERVERALLAAGA